MRKKSAAYREQGHREKCAGRKKALELRGLLDALDLMAEGLPSGPALDLGITNKTFDSYEQGLIRDVTAAREALRAAGIRGIKARRCEVEPPVGGCGCKPVAYSTALAYPVGIIFAAALLGIFLYATRKRTAKV